MTGCLFKRKLQSGASWGYSFFAGWDANGKRLQIFKSGFSSKTDAASALRAAISDHEAKNGTLTRDIGAHGNRTWGYLLGEKEQSGFATKAAAEEALRSAIVAQEADGATAKARTRNREWRFAAYFEHWIEEHASRRCAPKTIERYHELGRYLIEHVGHTPNQRTHDRADSRCDS